MRYFLRMLCPAGHETRTELFHAEDCGDGTMTGSAGSAADYCLVCEAEPEALNVEGTTEFCEWYALCDNAAVRTQAHPILGDVPICQRCSDKVAALSA